MLVFTLVRICNVTQALATLLYKLHCFVIFVNKIRKNLQNHQSELPSSLMPEVVHFPKSEEIGGLV